MVENMGIKENDLQEAIVIYLRSLVDYELKGKLGFMHIANEAGLHAGIGWHAKRKRMGLLPGVADLLLLFPSGRSVWVELKVDRLKIKIADPFKMLTAEQKNFREMVQALGFKYEILACKSIRQGVNGIFNIICDEFRISNVDLPQIMHDRFMKEHNIATSKRDIMSIS